MQEVERNGPDLALLFGEITHRIANEYGSAISMLSLAAAKTVSPEARMTLQNAAERLHDHATAYRALQIPLADGEVDLADYICNICRAISRSRLRDRSISLEVAADSLVVTTDQAWYVGLIVSELVTNAARHAFRERAGCIRVETSTMAGQVQCRVVDNGVALMRRPPGRGSEINDALAARLGGTLNRTFGSAGTSVTLTFPSRRMIPESRQRPRRASKINGQKTL
jgi:two-component sensor histidine kinase